jgi:basic amino acid/polyamine antiporter, APA family
LGKRLAGRAVFVRDATGLVKAIGPFAAFLFGAQCISPPSSGYITYAWLPYLWPGSDILTILTLGMIFSLVHAVTYSQIGSVYPRSGADYVFASRNLTPVGAFSSNFTLSIFSGLVAGALIAWIPSTLMSSYFTELGALTNQAYLTSWGATLTSGIWVFIIGSVATLVTLALMLISPSKTIAYLKYSFYLAMLSWAIILVSLAVSNPNSFAANWNTFMGAGNFQKVISTAQANGLTYQYSPAVASLAGLIMGFWIFYGYYIPTFFAGEVKRAPRTLLLGSVGSLVFMWALFAVGAILLTRLVPLTWLGAEGYLFYGAPGVLTALPFISFYAAVAVPNIALAAVVFVGFLLSLIALCVTYFYYVSRNFFAWSFDRLAPESLARVKPNGAPWVSVLLITVLAEIGLGLSIYTTIFVQLNFTLFAVLCMMVPVISAVILPWKNKQAFQQAPSLVNRKIAGIPAITLFGSVTFAYLIWMVYASYAYPAVGGYITGSVVGFFLTVVVVGVVIFYVAKYYRAKQGLDLKFIYSSIPPE